MGQSDEWVLEVDGEERVYRIVEGPDLDRLTAWVDAHGVDHRDVPVPGRAKVAEGQLTIETYALDDNGQRRVEGVGDDTRVVRTTHTVPLVADPPDCWVRREVGTGGTA